MPASSSARMTPMCARPRAEPLPSARPTRARCPIVMSSTSATTSVESSSCAPYGPPETARHAGERPSCAEHRNSGAPRRREPGVARAPDVDADGAVAAKHRVEPALHDPAEPAAFNGVQECAERVHGSRTSQRPCHHTSRAHARIGGGTRPAMPILRRQLPPCRHRSGAAHGAGVLSTHGGIAVAPVSGA